MYEYPHGLQDVCNKLMVKPLVPDQGYVELPTEPGIGIEINEAALKEYAYGRHAPRPLRTVEDERELPQGRRLTPARGLGPRVTGSSSIATFMPRLSGWRLPFYPCLTI